MALSYERGTSVFSTPHPLAKQAAPPKVLLGGITRRPTLPAHITPLSLTPRLLNSTPHTFREAASPTTLTLPTGTLFSQHPEHLLAKQAAPPTMLLGRLTRRPALAPRGAARGAAARRVSGLRRPRVVGHVSVTTETRISLF